MKQVEIVISPTGDIKIDAQNFKGAECEKATAELSKALGDVSKTTNKPERFTHTGAQGAQQKATR